MPQLPETPAPLLALPNAHGHNGEHEQWGDPDHHARRARLADQALLKVVFLVSDLSPRRTHRAHHAVVQVSSKLPIFN